MYILLLFVLYLHNINCMKDGPKAKDFQCWQVPSPVSKAKSICFPICDFFFSFSKTGFHIIRCNISVHLFSVFCIGFYLLIFLPSSRPMLLAGIFRLLWHQVS